MPRGKVSSDRMATAWDALVLAARAWSEHMDQFDKVKFNTVHGPVYLRIGRSDPHPDGYEALPEEKESV